MIEETYQYDKRGNLTEVWKNGRIINQYHFGALNRLESAINHNTKMGATYTYDGLGNRVGKVEGNPIEPVLPDTKLEAMNLNPTKRIEDVLDRTKQYHNLLQRNENEDITSFTWDNNVLSATGTDDTYHYFQDDLGSPVRLLDGTGKEREVLRYDEFGQGLYRKQKINQPFGYTGYQKDETTNTYYAQAREYRPESGRFISEDFIKGHGAYPLTVNAYIYCWNQSLDLVDLNGQSPKTPDELAIFLDPGHGGDEKGASRFAVVEYEQFGPIQIGIPKVYNEKDINLQLALMVKDSLESQGVTVHMSRTTDVTVELKDRVKLANDSGADLFVSIHHNSSNPSKWGTEVLYPGIERHGDHAITSKNIAQIVNDLVHGNTRLVDRGIHERENLYVLNQTDMLAILTETGYMGGDIAFLVNQDNLQVVADNIALGILQALLEDYNAECIG